MYEMWMLAEKPAADRREAVLLWVADRMDDPYVGMQPEPAIPGLWWGWIPGTRAADGSR